MYKWVSNVSACSTLEVPQTYFQYCCGCKHAHAMTGRRWNNITPPPLCWCKKSEKGSTDETLPGLISPLICAFQTKLFTDMGVTQGGNRRGYTAEEVSKAESPLLSSRSLDVECCWDLSVCNSEGEANGGQLTWVITSYVAPLYWKDV